MAPTALFLALIALMNLSPFLRNRDALYVAPVIWFVVLVLAVVVIAARKSALIISLALAIPTFFGVTVMAATNTDLEWVRWCQLVFLSHVTFEVLRYVVLPGRVGLDKLGAVFSGYLLLGLVWTIGYELIQLQDRGAFLVPGGGPARQEDLFYFSFVTLTTLGYGDVQPVAYLARSLAVLEAVIGNLYLAVLVAHLVGTFGRGGPAADEEPKQAQ